MVKRIIFDLDKTLIPWDEKWDEEVENAFNHLNVKYTKEDCLKFWNILAEYEETHKRFEKIEMSRFFRDRMNIEIPDNFVEVWTSYLSELVPEYDSKLDELLKYLSSKYSLVVCSNWFNDQQVAKLKKFGIYKYFDFVITSDKYDKKPLEEMFKLCCDGFTKDEVVMVGDTYNSDIMGALSYGLYAYYLTTTDKRNSNRFKKIKTIYELKDYL